MTHKLHLADKAGNPSCQIVFTGRLTVTTEDRAQVTCKNCIKAMQDRQSRGDNMSRRKNLNCYELYWMPEGRKIATVEAKDIRNARRKAPQPYRRYLGEINVVMVGMTFGIENWETQL
jgi:uncharacterized membrane protein YjjP (DUF1212 family)